MESSAASVAHLEEGEENSRPMPRLETESAIEKLKRRFPNRRFACWCGSRPDTDSSTDEEPPAAMRLLAAEVGTVADIMASPVITVGLDVETHEIIELMETHDIRHLPVLIEGHLRGIVSDRDVLSSMSPFLGKMAERAADTATLHNKAHQLMTREVITIHPGASLCQASTLMEGNRIHCLPVLEGEELVGIITATDLLSALSVCEIRGRPDLPV